MRIKNISNMNRLSVLNRIKTDLFFHYLPLVFKKELDLKHYFLLIKRINVLLKSFKINKFYKIGKKINIDQNVPLYGTSSFYTYMNRFTNFDSKLVCTKALISITKECSFLCKHCYQKFDEGEDLDLESLTKATKSLLDHGVTNFIIEGGDPFIKFEKLLAICETIGHRGEVTINSTGNGITLERIKKLKSVCNLLTITLSMNSPIEEDINFFMGQDYAWNTIKHGLKLCKIATVPTSLNCCLHSGHYENGNFEYLMELAKDFGISHVKLIHPKAAGAWLHGNFPEFEASEIDNIKATVKKFNRHRKYKKYPAVTAQVIEEDSDHYGCTAGGSDRVYINAKGDIQPCEFLNMSFGNIKDEEFNVIFERMRSNFNTPGTKWLCDEYSKNISSLHKNDEALPISIHSTEGLIDKWNRGDATPLYYKIEKELS